jgi:AbiV family abortive infection protein
MRLSEADALLVANFPTQAAIVFTFAVEEFGKAVLLRRAFEASGETDMLVVIDGFYEHTAKLDAAATEIPARGLLLGRGAVQASLVQTNAFQISPSAKRWKVRVGAMFVDWVADTADGGEGHWQWGVKTDANVLAASINAVQARLSKAMVEWT